MLCEFIMFYAVCLWMIVSCLVVLLFVWWVVGLICCLVASYCLLLLLGLVLFDCGGLVCCLGCEFGCCVVCVVFVAWLRVWFVLRCWVTTIYCY